MKRYKIRCHDCDPEIVQHDAGKWVRYTDVESLRAELELHKGALIAEQEHVETLEAELAAWRSALAKVGPYYVPATSVSDEEAEEVYAAIDAARKGKGE